MDIANLVCRDLDLWIKSLAESFGIGYSRYVDDLSFTGRHILSGIAIMQSVN